MAKLKNRNSKNKECPYLIFFVSFIVSDLPIVETLSRSSYLITSTVKVSWKDINCTRMIPAPTWVNLFVLPLVTFNQVYTPDNEHITVTDLLSICQLPFWTKLCMCTIKQLYNFTEYSPEMTKNISLISLERQNVGLINVWPKTRLNLKQIFLPGFRLCKVVF